jgi:hypothetical protein
MEQPELLSSKIKEWIQLDTEINVVNAGLKDKKKMKKDLTDALMRIMKEQDIEIVKLNDGSIEIKKSKVKTPINQTHLRKCLSNFVEDDTQVQDIVKCIYKNRDEKVKESIKRIKSAANDT